jgi:hypothetical protein
MFDLRHCALYKRCDVRQGGGGSAVAVLNGHDKSIIKLSFTQNGEILFSA